MINKLDIFIIKYANPQQFISKQNEIKRLFEKDIFKDIMLKNVVSNIDILNSYFAII